VASVGFLAIVSLPLRMGELVRPYLIADPPRIRMSHGLGTMAVERVFDGLILSLVTFIAVAEAKTRADAVVPPWIMASGLIAFGLFLAVLVAAVMALWQKERAVDLCRRLFSIISPTLGDKTAKIAAGIVDGFKVLPNWRLVTFFIIATCAYWLFNGIAIWRLAHGFGMDLSFWGGIGVLVIVGIGIMIPAGPAFAGNFELFAGGALGLYLGKEIIAQKAAAFILTFHMTNFGWYALIGFLAMFSKEVSFTAAWDAVTKEDKPEDEEE
jgi:glycosyltransferase 2 family protein